MTRKEQRNLVTRFAASGLPPTPLSLLKELITASWAGKNHFATAEMPFEISLNKLAVRTNLSRETIVRGLETLKNKGLLSILKSKPGIANRYLLDLSSMEAWESSRSYKNRAKRERQDRQVEWARAKREKQRVSVLRDLRGELKDEVKKEVLQELYQQIVTAKKA